MKLWSCSQSAVSAMATPDASFNAPAHVCSHTTSQTPHVTLTPLSLLNFNFPADGVKCDMMELKSEVDAVWSCRRVFQCPFCWSHRKEVCFKCKMEVGEELLKCCVGGCENRFCRRCWEDLETTASFGFGFFICPHHFCHRCKSIEGQSESNPLIPCLMCPKAAHLRCLPPRINQATNDRVYVHSEHADQPSQFSKDVMLCEEHQMSLADFWKELLVEWKSKWLATTAKTAPHSVRFLVRPTAKIH